MLAVCADAIRRRALGERAARPARFGGGEVAIVSARLPDAQGAAAVARVEEAGAGVVLADWAAIARDREPTDRKLSRTVEKCASIDVAVHVLVK